LKIFKTNDFAQTGERYRLLDKTGQEHMIGKLVAALSHVTIPAIQRRAIENVRQDDATFAASVAKGLGL
jgi:catalase